MPKLSAMVFHTLDAVKDDGQLLFGCGTSGIVYQLETGTSDDSDTVTTRWTTPWLDMEVPEVVKVFRALHLTLDLLSNKMTVNWSVDDGKASGTMYARFPAKYSWGGSSRWNDENGSIQGGMYWVRDTSIRKQRLLLDLPQDAVGERIQFEFTETSGGAGFGIADVEILWRPRPGSYPTGGI